MDGFGGSMTTSQWFADTNYDESSKYKKHAQARLYLAYLLSMMGYGLLQAGGTAGYMLLLLGNEVPNDPSMPDGDTHIDIDWSYAAPLAGIAFLSVLIINGMLVREDIIKGLVHKDKTEAAQERHKNAHRSAWIATLLSAFVLGLITAYGLQATIDSLMDEFGSSKDLVEDENPDRNGKAWISIAIFTCVVGYAEFRLMLKPMREAFEKISDKKSIQALLPDFENSKPGAKMGYYFLLGSIVIGVLGTALICTPTLAKWFTWVGGDHTPLDDIETSAGSEYAALTLLILITLTQVPLYMDRAKGLMKSYLDSEKNGFDEKDQDEEKPIEGWKKNTFLTFWPINAAANAPLAFLGVASTLAMFKKDDISGLAFFESDDYVAKVIIFLAAAFIASIVVNSKLPPQAPDVKKEKNKASN